MHRGPNSNRKPSIVALLTFCFFSVAGGFAQTAETPEIQLVQKVLGRIGNPTSIALSVTNVSSLPTADAERSHREIEKQFRLHGVRIAAPEQAPLAVIVTFSENVRGPLWMAEILEGTNRDVVLLPVGKRFASSQASENNLSLQSRLTLTQPDPILDFVESASPGANERQIFVLSPDKLLLYTIQQGRLQPTQAIPLNGVNLKRKDPRGRLVVHDNVFDAYLPGYRCGGNAVGAISASCQQSDDPWPLLAQANSPKAFYANTRNFFTGVLASVANNQPLPAFYSAAVYNATDGLHFLVATNDGRLQFETGGSPQIALGSDLGTLKADCSDAWFVLASFPSEWTKTDSLQLFSVNGSELLAASRPVELPGPVLGIWNPAPAQSNVTIRNLQTGAYEAYTINAACTH